MTVLAVAVTTFAIGMTVYYFLLLALARHWRLEVGDEDHNRVAALEPMFVVVVPARDEAMVIGRTVEALAELEGGSFIALVMDDGSQDGTASAARQAAGDDERFIVVERAGEIAGRGKGDVLNHAYRIARRMAEVGDPRLGGASADEIVMCILDADGWLEPHTLETVGPYFDQPDVSGVQLPVRMWNARSGFLARMQDIEFVAYGYLFQAGRDRIGSVLMGGNGQFVRLSSLVPLGDAPWTKSLTEDLDIGLRLVEHGWRHRFCPNAYVAQQALGDARRFVRQRTRWVQGHLCCWSHLPAIWSRSCDLPLKARADLSLHLLLGAFGLIAALQLAVTVGIVSGVIDWQVVTPGVSASVAVLLVSVLVLLTLAPVLLVAAIYQQHAEAQLPWAAVPGVFLVFCFYHYLWGVPAVLRACWRIARAQDAWTKTARSNITHHDLAAAMAREGSR